MNDMQIDTATFTLPILAYSVLEVCDGDSTATSLFGQVKEVTVPESGVRIRFLDDSNKDVCPPIFVSTTYSPDPVPNMDVLLDLLVEAEIERGKEKQAEKERCEREDKEKKDKEDHDNKGHGNAEDDDHEDDDHEDDDHEDEKDDK